LRSKKNQEGGVKKMCSENRRHSGEAVNIKEICGGTIVLW